MSIKLFERSYRFIVTLSCLLTIAGCNGNGASDDPTGVVGTDTVSGAPQPVPHDAGNGSGDPNPNHDPSSRVGETCHSDDPNKICLALKYVVYEEEAGAGIITPQEAVNNVVQMNALWSVCGIAFEVGEFTVVSPAKYGFVFNASSQTELSNIRREFADDRSLLVVTTGTWTGSLGALATNAWTMMPGSDVQGVVMEAPVAKSPKLIAHELGHYLNLDHVSDSTNMMSPVIYQYSTALTASQCTAARSAAKYYWSGSYR